MVEMYVGTLDNTIAFHGKTRGFTRLQLGIIKSGLELWIKTGMHLTSPKKTGGTMYSICKKELGLKGSKEVVLKKLIDMIARIERGPELVK